MALAPVNLLWTSGWDSTFRVGSLLMGERNVVQPWYIKDPGRRSTATELRTMDKIRGEIERLDPAAAELLLPTKVIEVGDIPADSDTTRRFDALRTRGHLGSQYDWLSRFAQWQGITLELGIELRIHHDNLHDGRPNGPGDYLRGNVEPMPDGRFRLRPDLADSDLGIFAPFVFPILDVSKPEMLRQAESLDFASVMKMTWFCFNPLLDGTPCGQCTPCRFTAKEGLGWRIPKNTPRRAAEAAVLRHAWWLRNRALEIEKLLVRR